MNLPFSIAKQREVSRMGFAFQLRQRLTPSAPLVNSGFIADVQE